MYEMIQNFVNRCPSGCVNKNVLNFNFLNVCLHIFLVYFLKLFFSDIVIAINTIATDNVYFLKEDFWKKN